MNGPLAGLKVIDLTTVLMGPFATQLLADLGADVIKVEPLDGDPVRGIGPSRSEGMGALFLQANRGKRSIAIDLKQWQGREIVLDLARNADLFIYNIRPKAMERLGLQYSDLTATNPNIIYAGLLGYGQDGRYAPLPAFDDLIQAGVGLPYLFQAAGGSSPRYVPLAMADRFAGMWGLSAILSALWYRERTGSGQSIEIPMFETMAQLVLADHIGGRLFEPPIGSTGYGRLMSKDRRPFATKDGHVCVVVYNDAQWRRFFNAIGKPEVFDTDPRFTSISSRTNNIDTIYSMVAEIIREWSTEQCISVLRSADIPVTPLRTVDDLLEDPHLVDSGFFKTVCHPSEGKLRMPGIPARFSETEPEIGCPAPHLGEQTYDILRMAGYDECSIDKLIAGNVVGAAVNRGKGKA